MIYEPLAIISYTLLNYDNKETNSKMLYIDCGDYEIKMSILEKNNVRKRIYLEFFLCEDCYNEQRN